MEMEVFTADTSSLISQDGGLYEDGGESETSGESEDGD